MASIKIMEFFKTSNRKYKINTIGLIIRNIHDVTSKSAKKVTHTGQVKLKL